MQISDFIRPDAERRRRDRADIRPVSCHEVPAGSGVNLLPDLQIKISGLPGEFIPSQPRIFGASRWGY